MAAQTIRDGVAWGQVVNPETCPGGCERMTARDLIRRRLAREVRDHNGALALGRVGPVSTVTIERPLTGGSAYGRGRWLDWETECARVLRAFQYGGLAVLVDLRPVADPDALVDIRPETSITFVRTVPRAGSATG